MRANKQLLRQQAGRVQQLRDGWVRPIQRRGAQLAQRTAGGEHRVAAGRGVNR
jgi:hypothetical protein